MEQKNAALSQLSKVLGLCRRNVAKTKKIITNKGYSWIARPMIVRKQLREIFKYKGVTKKPKLITRIKLRWWREVIEKGIRM